MANLPEFDFSSYNSKDPWQFPPQRLVRFALEAREVFSASRNKWLRIKPYPDARYMIFHELGSDCFALGSVAMMLRERATDIEWWNSQAETPASLKKTAVMANHMAMRGMLQFGFFHGVARQLDHIFRQVLRNLDPEARENGPVPFSQVRKVLFQQTSLEKYSGLLTLILLIRDSMTHNGRFCPITRKDLSLDYGGKTYIFKNNEEVEVEEWGFIDTWDFLLYLLKETDKMLNELFESPFVALIPYIQARYLEK